MRSRGRGWWPSTPSPSGRRSRRAGARRARPSGATAPPRRSGPSRTRSAAPGTGAGGSPEASDPQRGRLVQRRRRAGDADARQRLLPRLLLGLFAARDDVTALEQDALGDLPPQRLAAQQVLEIHGEVLELLALRVLHHGDGLAVGLDRDPLLVPADRLGLL